MDLRECYEPAMERAVKKSLRRLDGHCRRFIELSPFVCLGTVGGDDTMTATNLTGLQTTASYLSWQVSNLNAPAEIPTKDYLFFAPANATSYTPFAFPANAYIDIFSFKSGSGCVGDLYLFDNVNDPLNANVSINSDHNIVILGAGAGNKYVGNESGNIGCQTCFSEAGVLGY